MDWGLNAGRIYDVGIYITSYTDKFNGDGMAFDVQGQDKVNP